MSGERITTVVEIDVDACTRTWGNAPCTAAFSADVKYKCFNTFQTCTVKSAYNKTTKTIRFCEASYPIKNGNYIPALLSTSGYEQTVNISGYKSNIGALGQRASVNISLADFPDRDTLLDPYWEQRMSGAAQSNGVGYDPLEKGTFWTKFKARNPNYAGRALRVIQGTVSSTGEFVPGVTRAYVITEMTGPGNSGKVSITANDILALADDKKAIAPVTSKGKLRNDITETSTTAILTPAGIGNADYPSSGFATIGSEIVAFTRSGDTLTIDRGRRGTSAASHYANDTVQVALDFRMVRADVVIRSLLLNYARIPSSYITFSDWQAEFDKWGAHIVLSATICKPTGVAQLIGEISQLGVTLWWDEVAQKIRLKLEHPPEETPVTWSDRNNLISIQQEDNDKERATRVAFWHMQIDPTKELNKDNFLRGNLTVYVDGESPDFYGEERTHTIYSRWLNHGVDTLATIIGLRILNRYKIAPTTYIAKIDVKDNPSFTDVINLDSYVVTDPTGNETPTLTQVFYRKDDRSGDTVIAHLQRFQFNGRYGVITENSRPNYNSSTEAQKTKGTYFVGSSLVFADGKEAYKFA